MPRMIYSATDASTSIGAMHLVSIDNEQWICVDRLPSGPQDFDVIEALFGPQEVPKDNKLHFGRTGDDGEWYHMTFTTAYIKRWGTVTFHKPIPCPPKGSGSRRRTHRGTIAKQ